MHIMTNYSELDMAWTMIFLFLVAAVQSSLGLAVQSSLILVESNSWSLNTEIYPKYQFPVSFGTFPSLSQYGLSGARRRAFQNANLFSTPPPPPPRTVWHAAPAQHVFAYSICIFAMRGS